MNKSVSIAVTLLLVFTGIPSAVQGNNLPTVVSVGDGDTIKVKSQQQTITVRLSCIDAPEIKQKPWGERSRVRLKQLLPPGTPVNIRTVDKDKYGRTVAEVFSQGRSINLQMVREGHAVVYRQYLNGCATTKNQYLVSESQAKSKKLGFWNQAKPVMPWDFRHGKKPANQPTSTTPVRKECDPAYPDVCIPPYPPDLDCGEISYRNFRVLASDPHGFDGDGDGVGCER
jgi:micrococcal nuclease